jgi:beta-mannosidase
MKTIDLSKRDWEIRGWRPFCWYLQRSAETDFAFPPCNGPFPVTIPGSAQTALRQAGVIKDWNIGLNSLDCEWVEHRHWEFFTQIKAGEIPAGERVVMHADGLDYSGWICVEDHEPILFSGALKRHEIDLSDVLGDGKDHLLRIIFDSPPEDQGQVGFTSRTQFFKPRYNFSWDWCPRFVPVGIWDALSLRIGARNVRLINHYTSMESAETGRIILRMRNDGNAQRRVAASLTGTDGSVRKFDLALPTGFHKLQIEVDNPALWWPNGHGEQMLYRLRVSSDGEVLHDGQVGFKRVCWLPSLNAPANARPLLCEVNGKPIFIQGINWTPVLMDYPDAAEDRYRRLIAQYKELGVNVLRVWGGAYLEREHFYQLCDEAGLMVWQEFPLCSSGCDSCPPESDGFLKELADIATDYVRRRSSHASVLLFCGGNELQTYKDSHGNSYPLTEAHPAMQVLRDVVERESPGVRFLPTSPSGPLFARLEESLGQGLHHHVHAPWDSKSTRQEWHDYWDSDDAIFRAEAGVVGASSLELISKYAGDYSAWPCSLDNPLWNHSAAFWTQPQLVEEVSSITDETQATAEVIRRSQERQAEFLAYAVRSCKHRFPQCTGFMVWMGHDAFPVPSNTSIIDFDGTPKPAFHALKEVFHEELPGRPATRTKPEVRPRTTADSKPSEVAMVP